MKRIDNAIGHAATSAVSLLKDRKRTLRLLDAALRRLRKQRRLFDSKGLTGRLQAATRLVSMAVRREYPNLPWRSLVLITAGVVYFVSPVDALPDFIPMLGFADDVALLAAILASVSEEIDAFLEWERSREESPRPLSPHEA